MTEPKLIILNDAHELYVRAAEEIAHITGEAICTHGEFTFCLSGGSTPAATYDLLATRFHLSVDWKEVQFYWGDERCVPPDQRREQLRDGESHDAEQARAQARPGSSDARRRSAGAPRPPLTKINCANASASATSEFPRFDLVMLGLGDNRHTASLFPGDPAIHETQRMVVAVEVDAEPRRRLTFTPPVINNAQRVMFLVAGQGKAAAVKDVLEGPRDPDKFPAQLVAPADGEVIWMLDKAAASLLSPR